MSSPQWRFADFRLDPDNACLWRGTQTIALTPKAFDVLHYLVTHPDRLVTKDTLLDAVWPETAISDAVVRVAIGELRRALGDTAQAPRFIATVHRRGYRFVAPVAEHTEGVPVLPARCRLQCPRRCWWRHRCGCPARSQGLCLPPVSARQSRRGALLHRLRRTAGGAMPHLRTGQPARRGVLSGVCDGFAQHDAPPSRAGVAGGGTPPPHRAVLRSGRLDHAGGAPGPGRLPRGRARLPSDLCRGDSPV